MWNLGIGEASVAQIGDQELDARDKVRASCSWPACRENSCVGSWPGSGDRVGVGLPWGQVEGSFLLICNLKSVSLQLTLET